MVFQLQPKDTRPYQYPDVQDQNFLGYDRPNDRWKVDASGIKIYASGISVELDHDTDSVAVWSASGTTTLPVYLEGGSVEVDVDLDYTTDSVSVWSASGTRVVPVYQPNVDVSNTYPNSQSLNVLNSAVVLDWGTEKPLVPGEFNPLLVTPSGRLLVETYPSATASGIAQKSIITDSNGHDAVVSPRGALQVTFSSAGASAAKMIDLEYNKIYPIETVPAVWENVMQYTVPNDYTLEIIEFSCSAANATSSARVATSLDMGAFNIATTTFVDQAAYSIPYFGSRIELFLTSGTVGAATITVTYTNQDGVAGRTGSYLIPTLSIAGQAFKVPLQGNDYGVRDVTNVTTVGGTSGTLQIHGVVTIFSEVMTTANQTYNQITSRESVIVDQNETIDIGVSGTQKAAAARYIHILGQLRSVEG